MHKFIIYLQKYRREKTKFGRVSNRKINSVESEVVHKQNIGAKNDSENGRKSLSHLDIHHKKLVTELHSLKNIISSSIKERRILKKTHHRKKMRRKQEALALCKNDLDYKVINHVKKRYGAKRLRIFAKELKISKFGKARREKSAIFKKNKAKKHRLNKTKMFGIPAIFKQKKFKIAFYASFAAAVIALFIFIISFTIPGGFFKKSNKYEALNEKNTPVAGYISDNSDSSQSYLYIDKNGRIAGEYEEDLDFLKTLK